jgi:hypothetical protein
MSVSRIPLCSPHSPLRVATNAAGSRALRGKSFVVDVVTAVGVTGATALGLDWGRERSPFVTPGFKGQSRVHLIYAPKKTTHIITECIEINVTI